LLNLTDDEYVEKIIKLEASRKKTIIIIFIFSLLILIPLSYYASQIIIEANELSLNLKNSDKDKQLEAIKEYDRKSQYHYGLIIGAFFAMAFFSIASLLGQAIALHFTGRKDRLLIKHYNNT